MGMSGKGEHDLTVDLRQMLSMPTEMMALCRSASAWRLCGRSTAAEPPTPLNRWRAVAHHGSEGHEVAQF
jgi:hypothetical protein